jgi:site-specific DNA-methyltransferase (adenine-specific)
VSAVSVVPHHDVPARGDALILLRSLPECSATAAFFDPQHRSTLDRLKYGNEGARQKARHALPAMSDRYIKKCCNEIARVLRPSGYFFLWADAFRLCRGDHLRVKKILPCVDLVAWDSLRPGMGYRTRRRGDYLIVLQKPPLRAKVIWRDHGIPDRWAEKVDRKIHPHIKPIGLIRRLIAAVTLPGDLVVDPAAGSFIVMRVAHEMGRRFVGCDLRVPGETLPGRRHHRSRAAKVSRRGRLRGAIFDHPGVATVISLKEKAHDRRRQG